MRNSVIQNRVLHVDLSEGTTYVESPPESLFRKLLGGRGLALHYLLKLLTGGSDPLGAENVLVIAAGLLNGIAGPGIPKFSIAGKSPLTGGIGESEAGGFWGPELRLCGFDAVVIRGCSNQSVYIVVEDQKAYTEQAGKLWASDTKTFQTEIRKKYPKARVLQIGRAGTRRVRYANVVNDLSFFNGRNGLGAVMGSKNLRAVVLSSSRNQLDIPGDTEVLAIAREAASAARSNLLSVSLHDLGTAGGIAAVNASGALPSFNWRQSVFEEAEAIGGENLREQFLVKRHGCFACPIRCKRVVAIEQTGMNVDPAFGGPEYESIAALGSLCGVTDLPTICKANELCNRYGMDTISTGATIAFAMQCFDEGLIAEKQVGYDLSFGNASSLLRMIEDIAAREGFGDILAEGSFRAARKIGKGAYQYCHHTKKQELPMHDPRIKTGIGLQYALSPRGADHWIAQHDPFFKEADSPGVKELTEVGVTEPVAPEALGADKVRLFHVTQMLCSAYDCLGVCNLAAVARSVVTLKQILGLVEAATEWKTNWQELLTAGERSITMARLFNLREGFSSQDDLLSAVFFKDIKGGPREGGGAIDPVRFEQALKQSYDILGWDKFGIPLKRKLIELGLDEYE